MPALSAENQNRLGVQFFLGRELQFAKLIFSSLLCLRQKNGKLRHFDFSASVAAFFISSVFHKCIHSDIFFYNSCIQPKKIV
mgnify:CR=1 FL=1